MNSSVYRPENFFLTLHPREKSYSGNIILERRIGASIRRSQVRPSEFEELSKRGYNIPDLYFSTATFSARPLIVNFNRVGCLHLQVPKSDWNTSIILPLRLGNNRIPQPTAITWDGTNYTFLWALDTPIEAHELHIYALLQRCLHELAKDFNPTDSSSSNIFLTRLIGSKNSANSQNILLDNGSTHKTHSRRHIEDRLLEGTHVSVREHRDLERQAGILRELLVLFKERLFDIPKEPRLFKNWTMFFGAALSKFCSPLELETELTAIAESLENRSWPKISGVYEPLIKSIIRTVLDGYINYDGQEVSIDHPGWLEILRRDLAISEEEIKYFKLLNISGSRGASPHLTEQQNILPSFGISNFVPISTLFFHQAA